MPVATALLLKPVAVAMAFNVVLALIEIGAEYLALAVVGVPPSVV
jgi:hypothetical protein